jgi:phosphoglycerate dehydrogenase-like enzyme
MNILIAHEFPDEVLVLIRAAAQDGAITHYYPADHVNDIPAEVLAQADVLYCSGGLPAPEAAPALRWVQAHSAGVDHFIDHPLFARGRSPVQLTTASGVHAINIGEYILMMMLALAHHLPVAYAMMRQQRWSNERARFTPQELHGATVGMVGFGAIARYTAQLCQALGMRVLAMRRSTGAYSEQGVVFYPRAELGKLLTQSDFVVITTPLTPETYHLIDVQALAEMKPSAFLVNIARGDIIDEGALIAALREGRLAGAALDVFAQEPLPDDSPLWRMDNVILTPHIAGITPHYERRAGELFAENLRRFVAGQPLLNKVDFARGY